MKLGALKSAIREMKGAPGGNFRIGHPDEEHSVILEDLEITKQSLLVALDKKFPGGRSVETNLFLDGRRLRNELSRYPDQVEQQPESEGDELEDLLG